MEGLLGKKIGMTQIFAEDGRIIPVTVVKAGPCAVIQRKRIEVDGKRADGYEAVQLGLIEERPARKVGMPLEGHFKKAGVAPMKKLGEFAIEPDEEWKEGDQVKASIFEVDDYVDVVGKGKGKGFQGVMKRHGFSGGKATHGSMFHRAPGSVGQASYPARIFPGVRMPGRMGGKRVTAKNLQVVKVDEERNLLYLRGAVPGATDSYLSIRKAKRG